MDEQLVALRRIWMGFQAARVMITANNLGVFERLKKPVTAAEAARSIKADRRGTEILLDALTGIGVLRKKNGKYTNGPEAARYLVRGGPHYQGDILRHASNMWDRWSGLDLAVLGGRPVEGGPFDHEAFIMGMHNLSVLRVNDVLRATGLKGVKTALDLGGGPGTYAIEMSARGIVSTIFDLPETIRIAKKVARQAKAKGLRYIAGDFHVDDIGSGYDLVLLSQIFHAYPEKENRALLSKCLAALNPGGKVAVHEFPLGPDRTSPPHSALFSVNMLVGTSGGRCYTPAEMARWMDGAGFSGIKAVELPETVLVIGTKKGGR